MTCQVRLPESFSLPDLLCGFAMRKCGVKSKARRYASTLLHSLRVHAALNARVELLASCLVTRNS